VDCVSGYQLVRLASGAFSVHALAEDETFHPVIGPVAEAEALYVRQLRLVERLRAGAGEFVIWDVGLGAAANAVTVLRHTRAVARPLRLVSFDHTLAPLRFAVAHARELAYPQGYECVLEELLRVPCTAFCDAGRPVHWEVHRGDFPALMASAAAAALPQPDVIMFDAFSPAKNPAMWTLPLFARIHRLLDPARPCALPTYSRSTLLRVTLLLAGFFVGAGRATGEKEETTVAANAAPLIEAPLDRRWLARARRSTSAEPLREPVYRQARLSDDSWERLLAHPQFQ
jgi:tRNA U34 5-methylaminomethyl-2-thiouridine-forming methyltransferase MnmC